jgi:hypothetical protein
VTFHIGEKQKQIKTKAMLFLPVTIVIFHECERQKQVRASAYLSASEFLKEKQGASIVIIGERQKQVKRTLCKGSARAKGKAYLQLGITIQRNGKKIKHQLIER